MIRTDDFVCNTEMMFLMAVKFFGAVKIEKTDLYRQL